MRSPLRLLSLRLLSLRMRLLLLTAALLLAGLSLVSTVVTDQLQRYQLDRLDTQLRSFTTLLAQAPVLGPDVPADTASLAAFDPALDLIGTPYLAYLDAGGAVARGVHSSRLDEAALPTGDALRGIPTDGTAADLGAADGSRWRAVARPTVGRDGTVVAAAPLARSTPWWPGCGPPPCSAAPRCSCC
jgi:two-component system OmpR family sensor kinase